MATRTITHLYDTHDEAVRAVESLKAAGIPDSDISLVGPDGSATATPAAHVGATTGTLGTEPPPRAPAGRPSDTLAPRGDTLAGRADPTADYGTTPADPALHADTPPHPDRADASGSGAGAGATLGTLVGGGAGLLAGIGALAIPGIGPVVAAGWLIATLTGAGAGAAAGGLLGALTGAGVREEDAHVYAEGVRRGGTLVSVRVDDADAPRVEAILNGTGRVDIASRGAEYRAGGWTAFNPQSPGNPTLEGEAERARQRSSAI